jgi:hypothetical protein
VPEWEGEHSLHPIAVSASDPSVRVFSLGGVVACKYWPAGNFSDELPQLVANELHARLLQQERQGIFIEEVRGADGESMLVRLCLCRPRWCQ